MPRWRGGRHYRRSGPAHVIRCGAAPLPDYRRSPAAPRVGSRRGASPPAHFPFPAKASPYVRPCRSTFGGNVIGQDQCDCRRAGCRGPGLHLARDGGRPRLHASVRRNLRDLPPSGDRHPRRGSAPDQAGAVRRHGLGRASETDLPPQTARRRIAGRSPVRCPTRNRDLCWRSAWRISRGIVDRR